MKRKRRIGLLPACLLLAVIATYVATTWYYQVGPFSENSTRDSALETRDAKPWAQPVNLPGVPNAFRVSDGLYRGAQPTAQGLASLRKLGVKTVINLCEESDADKALADGDGFELVRIPLNPLRNPTDQEILKFLQTVSDPRNQPVFVHCHAGADRTGVMCAVYRIVVQGWDRQAALDEMTQGGFSFHNYRNLVQYIRTTDFERFRQTTTTKTFASETQ